MSTMIDDAFPKGTIEHITLDITDILKNVTDLSAANVRFDIRKKNASTYIQTGVNATVIGMRVFCLIDTTLTAYVQGRYELFVTFDNIPESPRLGPIEFLINA